jgi:hypothetical protein
MDGSVLVPVAFFAMIAAIVVVPKYLKSKEREKLTDTIRVAFEKGQPVPPELMAALTISPADPAPYVPLPDRAQRDLRLGVVWIAIGVGLLGIGGAFYAMLYNVGGAVETGCSFAALAAVPLCIGLAFLLLSALGRKKAS